MRLGWSGNEAGMDWDGVGMRLGWTGMEWE